MRACWCARSELQQFSAEYGVCVSCGTLVSRFHHDRDVARVTSDDSDLYGRDYWFGHMENDLGFANIYQRARTDLTERCPHWLNALLKYQLPPGRVLELGSAHGGFVATLKWAGFDASGLELSPAIAQIARTLFDVPMLVGPVEDQKIPPGSLDVIALMDVLEHLPDPVATMRHCIDLLTPDGFLLVQTPRYPDGPSFDDLTRDGDRFLEQLKANEHLYLYSERSVRQFFAELGLESLGFEAALFSHYDMFFVASRRPLAPIEPQVRDERLAATAGGRLVLALLDLHAQVQGSVSRAVLDEIEADRAARLEIIERLGAEVGHLAHENAVMRGELDGLRPAYAFGESDREARLRVIEDLGRQLSEAQHSLAAERGEHEATRIEHEATRIALETSEAEDIARLKVIEDQVRQLSELERTIAELRDQTQALRDKNVELEPRANRSIFQLILARLRGKP